MGLIRSKAELDGGRDCGTVALSSDGYRAMALFYGRYIFLQSLISPKFSHSPFGVVRKTFLM